MKRLFSLFLAMLLILSFAACGKKTDEVSYGSDAPPELYVGEGFRTILSTLMTGNFNIVETTAVYGKLETDESGKVTDKIYKSYNALLSLFKAIYSDEQAEKLIENAGYYEKDGTLYSGKKPKDEGTSFDISTLKIEVTAKDDKTCSFTCTISKKLPDGKEKTEKFKCKAVAESGTWLLEDMYY